MQKIISGLKKIDKDTYKIMNYGIKFSGFVCFIAMILLAFYIFLDINFLYHFGLLLMKVGFSFVVEFIVCGIIVDFIRKQGI